MAASFNQIHQTTMVNYDENVVFAELINLEEAGLLSRVADLEKLSADQANEVACLKSSLADCLRRLSLLEANRGTALCQVYPSTRSAHSVRSIAPGHTAQNGRAEASARTPELPASRRAPPRAKPTGLTSARGAARSLGGKSPNSRLSGSATTLNRPTPPGLSTTARPYPLEVVTALTRQQVESVRSGARFTKALSMIDGQLPACNIGSASGTRNTSPLPWQANRGSTLPMVRPFSPGLGQSRYYETSDGPTGYSVMWRSAYADDHHSGDRSQLHHKPQQQTPRQQQASTSLVSPTLREPVHMANDGVVRFFIRGRPINVYLPSTVLQSYDIGVPVPAPDASLRLEWVYGYRGKDCRNNLYYLPTGELIYFVAGVVVLYNIEEQCQRHYLEHTDDVKCIAVHPDRITVASGQVAGHHKQAGKDGGCRLAVVDEGQDHVISVWEWQKGRKITETKCSNDPVAAAEFHPLDENLIIVCGKNFLTFWTLDDTKLSRKNAVFETVDKPKFVLCLAFAENGDLLTGDSSGSIIVWHRGTHTISQFRQSVHDGGIFSLCVTQSGHVITGGGKDRRLVFLDTALEPTGQVKDLPDLHGSVRTIAQGPGDMLLVGTTKNTILQLAPGMEFSAAVFGHSDEFWALASHPQSHQFLTAGHDRLVVLWDSLSKQVAWAKELNDPIHCAAFFPVTSRQSDLGDHHGDTENGEGLDETVLAERLVALGSTSGRWLVMDTARHEVIAAHCDGIGEQIQCLSYSPNGQYLAIGSRDNSIYVYNVLEHGRKYNRIGRCTGHSSFVLNVDWSSDSRYLRSVSGDYELLFWTANDCRQVVAASTLRDVDWVTQTCTLGWNTIGIWLEGFDGSDINACASNQKGDLLAVGDDRGKVRLFRNPSDTPKANHYSYPGHSSHVTNVNFLFDDSRLLSTGGKDTAVLQWEVCT